MERIKSVQKELSIKTKRLKLRIFKPEDITEKYVAALNDPNIVGLTEARYRKVQMTIQDAVDYTIWANQGNSIFIGIFLDEGEQHIGNIRLHTISLENKRAELGIMIWNKEEWGKGYATEALVAFTNQAFNLLNLHKIEAEYYANNDASAKMFSNAGFSIEAIIKDHFFLNGKFVDAIKICKFNPNYND